MSISRAVGQQGMGPARHVTVRALHRPKHTAAAWTYVGQPGTGMRKVMHSHTVSSRMMNSHSGQYRMTSWTGLHQ